MTLVHEESGSNLKTALNIINRLGFDNIKVVSGNRVKVLVPHAERENVMKRLRSIFEPRGYDYDATRGGSIGQLKILDRKNGSVYLLVKPDTSAGSAARTGADYEEKMAEYIKQKYADTGLQVKTAGFGYGSDLELIGTNHTMTMELKTASGADFGQFRIGYNTKSKNWMALPTKGFKKNEQLFSSLFQDLLAPYLNAHAHFPKLGDERLNIRSGVVVGLKPHLKTGELRDSLNRSWFKGRSDLIVPIDFQDISGYYFDKGDEYIQIKGRGLYAFSANDAASLGVPLFSDKGKKAHVRFRIKPHMGYNGTHSFTVAIKLTIERSEKDLDNDQDLDMIVDKLL